MKLLPSQKNELYNLLTQHSSSSANFRYRERLLKTGRTEIEITFRQKQEYTFVISSRNNESFKINHAPAEGKFKQQSLHTEWIGTLRQFDLWLSCLKKEINQKDLWKKPLIHTLLGFTVHSLKNTTGRASTVFRHKPF